MPPGHCVYVGVPSLPPPKVTTVDEHVDEIDAAAPSGRRPGMRDAWLQALKWVLLTRLVFFAVTAAAAMFLSQDRGTPGPSFFEMWSHWDARLFFLVAEYGYTDGATDAHASAFFPLFPMLLKMVHTIGFDYVISGIIINTVACLVAFAYLYRWADEELGEGSGNRAVAYLAFFPTAVFLIAPYSEALFLAGAIPAFYYARRAKWHLAALPAAFASSARFAGLFLVIGLVGEFLRQKDYTAQKALNAAAAIGAGLLPMLVYFTYLARVKGSFFYYFTEQRDGWFRELTTPWESFRATWAAFGGAGIAPNWVIAWRLEIVAAMLGVSFVIWAILKKEWGYVGYMATFLATLMMSTWYFSVPRMLLGFFPVAIMAAGYSRNMPSRHEIILVATIPLAIMGGIAYTTGSWFF